MGRVGCVGYEPYARGALLGGGVPYARGAVRRAGASPSRPYVAAVGRWLGQGAMRLLAGGPMLPIGGGGGDV